MNNKSKGGISLGFLKEIYRHQVNVKIQFDCLYWIYSSLDLKL